MDEQREKKIYKIGDMRRQEKIVILLHKKALIGLGFSVLEWSIRILQLHLIRRDLFQIIIRQ
jgi:hypothetical protein